MRKICLFLLATAAVFLPQQLVWSCGKPDCHGPDVMIFKPDIENKNFNVNKPVAIGEGGNATAFGGQGGQGGAGGQGGQGGTGGQGGIGIGGNAAGGNASVGNFSGAVGSVGDIVIGGTNISVPRNFSELPPAVQQQFSFAIGGLYIKNHLDKEERRLLNEMLGPVPNPTSLSREVVAKNAVSKYDIGVKQIFNEIPVFEFFVKGDKGVSNFQAKLEFYEDTPQAGPAESIQFVQKIDGGKFQIVDWNDLEAAGWQIGVACIIQGVPGVWLSGLKWAGYALLMEQTGYKFGAVTGVYRSGVLEASGKNMQLGGSGNFLTGGAEQNAYNLLLGGGKGSGQNWQSQKFDVVLVGLKKVTDAPLLIASPPPPPPPKKEEAASAPLPPQIVEKLVEKRVEIPVPVVVNPFENLPKLEPIRFEINSALIKDFKTSSGVEFKNLKVLEETKRQVREKVAPLMAKYPDLSLYFIGFTSGEGPDGTFKTKTKEGSRISNNEIYNRGGLGGLRADAVSKEIVPGSGLDPNRCILASAGWSQNHKFDYGTNDAELIKTYQRSVHIILAHDIATAKKALNTK